MEVIHRVARSLKLGRLTASPAEVNIVALGLAAIVFSIFIFTFEDFWFIFTSNPVVFSVREFIYLPLAVIAASFSLISFFVFQPGFPRIAIGLFAASMAFRVLQWFVTIPSQQLKVVAVGRIVASLCVVFLYLRYRSETTES